MQFEEEKEFGRMKQEALKDVLKNQFSLEFWKLPMAGSFFGLLTGIAAAFTLPQEKIASNKWLNKYWNTAAEYPPAIFQQVTIHSFTVLGTIVGGCIDIMRSNKKIARLHATESEIQPVPLPEAEPVLADNTITDTKMQERVTNRRQEVTSQRTR